MTRSNISFLLRRAHEHFIASLGAVAVTAVMLMSIGAHAATHTTTPSVTPSVTILVPTVTIELLTG